MKETIGDFVKPKRRAKEITEYLVTSLASGYKHSFYQVRSTEFIVIVSKKIVQGFWERDKIEKIAELNTNYNYIEVYDKHNYEFMKEVGEHFGFGEIRKCWDNADLEK